MCDSDLAKIHYVGSLFDNIKFCHQQILVVILKSYMTSSTLLGFFSLKGYAFVFNQMQVTLMLFAF